MVRFFVIKPFFDVKNLVETEELPIRTIYLSAILQDRT